MWVKGSWNHWNGQAADTEGSGAQVWLLAAQLEIRQQRLSAARKILGMALGMCPKAKLFNAYINIEAQLGNMDRWEAPRS